MTRTAHWIFTLCASALLTADCSRPWSKETTQPLKKGTEMNATQSALPFGLNETDLPKVEVMYAFYSAKTGAGKQELTVSGSGKVTLLLTRTMGDNPTIREGTIDPKIVARLLDFMADQGFLGFADHYPAHHDPHARRVLRLVLPAQTKTVMLDEPGFPAFEMVAGATKFAASLALPETLNHRFFPNL